MSKVAIFPGSFDPITNGHLHLIERAATLFEKLVVVVGYNPNKQTTFTLPERLFLVRGAVARLPTVHVDSFTQELLVSYARRVGATVVIRGLRSPKDYNAEAPQAQMNRKMYPPLDTLFLFAQSGEERVSSSLVRELLAAGEAVDDLVPSVVADFIRKPHPL